MLGDGTGNFTPLMPTESCVHVEDEIRGIGRLKMADGNYEWLVARNNDKLAIMQQNDK